MATESKHFTRKELECPCCGICNVNQKSLNKLEALRILYNKPIYLSRASSCEKHNKEIGGSKHSEHIASEAQSSTGFDIKITNDRERFLIIRRALQVGFDRIGLYRKHNGLHLGDSEELDQEVFWIG